MALYTRTDFAIQALRQVLLPACLVLHSGWLYGLALYYLLMHAYYLALRVLWKLEPLAALDEFFLLDNEKNRANIVVVIKSNKVPDYERLRSIIINLTIKHPRLKHKLRKMGGQYFFEEIGGAELQKNLATCFVRNDSIKTDEDISTFIAREQIIRDPLDSLQYKFVFVPEFSKDESVFILKIHHCLSDGVTLMAITSTLSDCGYDARNFPRLIPRFSWWQNVLITLVKLATLPYSMLIAQISILQKGQRNEVHPEGAVLQGKRKVTVSKPLDITHLRDALKKKGVTLTDYIIVTSQLALSKIAKSTDHMLVSIPFTVKDYPQTLSELNIGNDFAALPFRL